ncbi:sporulation protein [Nocardia sp. NPDC052001]|uniref:sporulation protein n=1 Tax=Nocardia sp. NPDC052001 TaxID=3154853 RepID=UPI00342C629F
MKVEDVLTAATDSISVRRVYAEPIERDGITVITAAAVSGGGGGGGGTDENGQGGSGTGFGLGAKPVGAYVIRGGTVSWQPALDVNRLIAVLGFVVVAGLAFGARLAKRG